MSAKARKEVLASLTAAGAAYEIVERQMPDGSVCRVVSSAPDTLLDLLAGTAQFGDYEYISYRDEIYTFADVLDQTARLAEALSRLGVRQGDRVAICMRNYPEWPAAFFAPMALGAITVSLNGWWSGEEIAYGLRDAGATTLIVDGERLERIESELEELGVEAIAVRCDRTDLSQNVRHWDRVLDQSSPAPLSRVPISADDDCLMLYTSGSTGGPKAAISTHCNVIHALVGWEIEHRAQAMLRGDPIPREPFDVQFRMLVTIPLFHVTACHVCMLTALRFGRRMTLMYKWDADEAIEIIDRDRITHFISVPTITGDLVRTAEARGRTLPSLLAVGGGGSHRPAKQVLAIREVLENAHPGTGWGMTETNAIGTQIGPPDYVRVPTSSGRPSILMDMKIVDPEDGREVEPGDTGELWVRGSPVVRGYWNKPDATARAFQDGWFRTGDLAYFDDEEFIYVVDRIKDIVIRGGENISCLKVEDALYQCEGVAEAVAFGIPDERLGEELAAVVVPRKGAKVSADRLRAEMERHLGSFEVPANIVFRDTPLPRMATGKFAKRHIREAVLAQISNGR